MKDYGSYSNEDQLLTLLEQMQDETEEKDRQLAENAEMLAQKDALIADLRKQLKTSDNSSTVSQLKNKVQEQAQEIVSLNETIRSQNEWIGKLNGADLILKENEKLKADNARLIREAASKFKEAEMIVKENEFKYRKKKAQMEQLETETKKREAAANALIAGQKEHIRKEAEKMTAWEREQLRIHYKAEREKLKAAYRTKVTAHETQFFATTLYALLVTVLSAAKSDVFAGDFLAFFTDMWKNICDYIGFSARAAEWLAGFSGGIGQEVTATIVYYLLYVVVVVVLMAVPIVVFYFARKKFVAWYRVELADIISLWEVFAVLAVTIFLAEEIKGLLPLNLLLLNIVGHIAYCGIREYIKRCRQSRDIDENG